MLHRHLIRVVADGGWKIILGEQTFGPYPTRDEAIATARDWARNAEKQGHEVQIFLDGEETLAQDDQSLAS